MPSSAVPALTPPLETSEGNNPDLSLSQARISGLAFVGLCGLIALGATRSVDWWGQTMLTGLSSTVLDVAGFLLTLLGVAPLTGAVAVTLAVRGWQRSREQGLGPLLLFVGVGMEVLLKSVLPHPGPPLEFARPLHVPSFLHVSSSVLLHLSTPALLALAPPYAFPSGHMLRTTFLVAVASAHRPRWRLLGWVVVFAMAVTRVSCNDHWLSDVVGGTMLGWALAGVAIALEQVPSRKAGEVESK